MRLLNDDEFKRKISLFVSLSVKRFTFSLTTSTKNQFVHRVNHLLKELLLVIVHYFCLKRPIKIIKTGLIIIFIFIICIKDIIP